MGDFDYNDIFGLEGENEQETADPVTEDVNTGENEQEVADPATDEQENTGAVEEPGAEPETPAAGQSAEENSQFAAARRRAEAERDMAVRQAREEAEREAKTYVDSFFAGLNLLDPYTGKIITNREEYEAYNNRIAEQREQEELSKAGLTADVINSLVSRHPSVRAAQEAAERLRVQEERTREERARARVEEQIKALSELDPSIKSLEDLRAMPTYDRFYELVKKGNDFTDAFRLANFETLTQSRAAAASQAAINKASSKQHFQKSDSRGTGAPSVPADVVSEYRALMPDASIEEIQKHYVTYLKK